MTAETYPALSPPEFDLQAAVARRTPRSIKDFMNTASSLVCQNEAIAEQCNYALPRDGKVIEGPSARFAEMLIPAWRNCRAGARVIAVEHDAVVAQGVYFDLEANTAITFEVRRSIIGRYGRYSPDMINVTANAACSIALRNCVLKGIPKVFWEPVYERARSVILGDVKSLQANRTTALEWFAQHGITVDQICKKLGVKGVEDIMREQIVILRGFRVAVKDGDTTAEAIFAEPAPEVAGDATAAKEEITKTFEQRVDAGAQAEDLPMLAHEPNELATLANNIASAVTAPAPAPAEAPATGRRRTARAAIE